MPEASQSEERVRWRATGIENRNMTFYDKWILPRLINLAMRTKEAMRYRTQVVPEAGGVVLEIGVGSGLNLPLYGDGVERVYALDPSEALLQMARKKVRAAGMPVELLAHSGEAVPLADASVDTVVTTWTLCSIPDAAQALAEMRRVLKPGGALLFAEHGLAPDAGVRRWQARLNPLWGRLTGGYNLDRKMDALIAQAGFTTTDLKTEYARGPRRMAYVYSGRALPAAG